MRHAMSGRGRFRVLIATDGSPSARAAVATARAFPWPDRTRVRAVVVTDPEWAGGRLRALRTALGPSFERIQASAQRALARRWPDADAVTIEGIPIHTILREARRFSANVIVLGWRGHGSFRRLLTGSVSRGVVEQARQAVLVVRRAPREVRRVVIGIDGSPNARRAIDFAARLYSAGKAISVVRVIEPVTIPTSGLLPRAVRASVLHQAALMNKQLTRRARRDVAAAASTLKRAGWRVRPEVRSGAPLAVLLDVVDRTDSSLLIVGARAAAGLRRALLGSVAAGAVNRSRVPVLVVR